MFYYEIVDENHPHAELIQDYRENLIWVIKTVKFMFEFKTLLTGEIKPRYMVTLEKQMKQLREPEQKTLALLNL